MSERTCTRCGGSLDSSFSCTKCGCDNRIGNERFPHFPQLQQLQAEYNRLQAENQRLKQYAQLVETAIEAEDANGRIEECWTVIKLHTSWFNRARALLAAGDAEVQQ